MKEIIERINTLRRERNAIILAHVYQPGEIQDIADFVGDSLGLANSAAKTAARVVVVAGVRFMAESVKLLNPEKTVLFPTPEAGCPMADMIDAKKLGELKRQHPRAKVVCYVNSSAEVKAASDICCTSSNALRIIKSIPLGVEIIFVPDKHLGRYLSEKSGRKFILFDGHCPVHQEFRPEDVLRLRATGEQPRAPRSALLGSADAVPHKENPGRSSKARTFLLAHPECSGELLALADFIGSTTEIIECCKNSPHSRFLVATEKGVFHQLKRVRPDAEFISVSEHGGVCPDMKLTTLSLIADALEGKTEEISIPPELASSACKALKRMMIFS
jgi:quinolinate synthase